MRRLARIVLFGVIGICVVYLIGANLLLMTSLGHSLASSERTTVRWTRGWSVLPTRVHLRGLVIDAHGKGGRWHIEADRADARIAALPLLRRTLEIPSAELAGVTIRGEDASPAPATPPDRPGQPSNEEPPILLVERIDGEGPRSDGWATSIRSLEATNVREIAIAPFTLRGDAKARGALDVDRDGTARFHELSVALESADVQARDRRFLAGLRGHLTLTSQAIAADEPASSAWLGTSDGGAELTGDVVGLPPLAEGWLSWPEHGRGTFRTSLRIKDGALAPSTTAALRVPAAANAAGQGGGFSADAVFSVAGDGRATLSASVDGGATVPVDTLRAEIFSPRVLLADPLAGATGTLQVSNARIEARAVPILSVLLRDAGAAPQPALLESDADLVIADGALSGRIETTAPQITLGLGDVTLSGPLRADVVVRAWHLGSGEADVEATITHGQEQDGSQITLTDAHVRRGGDGTGPSLDAHARFAMTSARAALDALTGRAQLPELVWIIAATQPLSGTTDLKAGARGLALRNIAASAGLVRVQGDYSSTLKEGGRSRDAALLVEAGPLTTGVSIDDGSTTLIFADARAWFEETRAAQQATPSR